MPEKIEHADLLAFTTDIVAAHVSGNQVPTEELPALIQKVYRTLASVQGEESPHAERPQPAVPIKKSSYPLIFFLSIEKKEKDIQFFVAL